MGGGGKSGPESAQLEAEFDKTGGCGRYQLVIGFIIILGMMCGGFVVHGLAILEMKPTSWMCPTGADGALESCDSDTFCA